MALAIPVTPSELCPGYLLHSSSLRRYHPVFSYAHWVTKSSLLLCSFELELVLCGSTRLLSHEYSFAVYDGSSVFNQRRLKESYAEIFSHSETFALSIGSVDHEPQLTKTGSLNFNPSSVIDLQSSRLRLRSAKFFQTCIDLITSPDIIRSTNEPCVVPDVSRLLESTRTRWMLRTPLNTPPDVPTWKA